MDIVPPDRPKPGSVVNPDELTDPNPLDDREDQWKSIGYGADKRTARLRYEREAAAAAQPGKIARGKETPSGNPPPPEPSPAELQVSPEGVALRAELAATKELSETGAAGLAQAREALASAETAPERAHKQAITRTPRLTRGIDLEGSSIPTDADEFATNRAAQDAAEDYSDTPGRPADTVHEGPQL